MRGSKLWTCVFHFIFFGLIAERALAGPPLTTIQDVIYKADGTRFNGVAYIEWKSFQAANQVPIATQSLTIAIVDGNLRVRLVPTTNASSGAYYYVRYHSDGRIQFSETWAVPPSMPIVNLAAVRAAVGQQTGGGTLPPAGLEIVDITGLSAELAARPVRGLGYASSRAIRTGTTGALEAVTGNLTDCIRVDGTSAACSAGGGSYTGPGFVDLEAPSGAINGVNTVFSLSDTPSPASSLELVLNGLVLSSGVDFTLSANSITMLTASTPRTGDVFRASFRTASGSNPTSAAGGALTGNYPNPQIAAGVVSNDNISAVAGIVESKLALNFPSHTSANDPTAAEKAALSGTAGAPSASNKFVTTNDSRLTDARTPTGHPLLSSQHADTTPSVVTRGDLIVGQGSSPSWTKLGLGAAGRCLTSNGIDAIWNTCLYTGFQPGAIPFVNSAGNLAENTFQLRWDSSGRKLSVGSSLTDGTLNVQDQAAATSVIVRSGAAQNTVPLQRWQDASGTDLARIDSEGTIVSPALQAISGTARAPWRDTGMLTDPVARVEGDAWFNITSKTRKSHQAGQTHATPQVICSEEGTANSSTLLAVMASCNIPGGLLQSGDRLEVLVDAQQVGTGVPWTVLAQWGSAQIMQRSFGSGDSMFALRAQAALYTGGTTLSAQHFNATGATLTSLVAATDPYQAGLSITVAGSVSQTGAGASVIVRNLTVIRYPVQNN